MQRETASPSGRDTWPPHTGHFAGMRNFFSLPVRFASTTFSTLGNYVAASFNQDPIADAQAQPLNLVFVMQSRARNRHAAELHRLEHRDRRQRARAAHLHDDVVQLLSWLVAPVFVSDGQRGAFPVAPNSSCIAVEFILTTTPSIS